MNKLTVRCPAKVNLFLEVTGRRRDGYHNLATLFAKIDLCDDLVLTKADSGIDLKVEGRPELSAGPDNLVHRAAAAFLNRFGVRAGVKIKLRKRIPMGAGLGGGSSDAAGALLGLARLFGIRNGRGVLRRLAKTLGADVPVFLEKEAFSLGRGIGERLTPVPARGRLPWLVLVYPGVGVPTAQAYKKLVLPSRTSVLTRLAELGKLKKKIGGGASFLDWAGLLYNRLEEPVLFSYPDVARAKQALAQSGARGVLMSGSGSSVFGFAASSAEARHIQRRLKRHPWQVFVTRFLQR